MSQYKQKELAFIASRLSTVYDRTAFVPTDLMKVLAVAMDNGIGHDRFTETINSLSRMHQSQPTPEIKSFLECIFIAPYEYKNAMQNKLHRAMEMLNKGEDPTLIVEFLDGVRRGIEDKTKSTPAQKAIAELESNPDLISEVVRDVAKRMFGGGVKESRSATVTWPK